MAMKFPGLKQGRKVGTVMTGRPKKVKEPKPKRSRIRTRRRFEPAELFENFNESGFYDLDFEVHSGD